METGEKWCPSGVCIGTSIVNIFISDLDSGIEYILNSFADYTKLNGEVNRPQGGQDVMQRHLADL